MGYLEARQLAYQAGRVSKQPDLGAMLGLYGRGVQATGDTPQRRRRVDEAQAEQYAREDQVSERHFRQQQALTQQRHPNAIPTTPEELAAYLDRKKQVAAITGKTFDQQKELLDLKNRFSKELIGERGDQSVRVEGVKQTGRVDLENQKQEGRVDLEGVKQGGRVELQGGRQDFDAEKQRKDLEAKAASLSATLADRNLTREERKAYNAQIVDLRKQQQTLGERKQSFFEFLKPKEEQGRNDRAAASQAGATTRTGMNNDAAMQRTNVQQAGANERNAANNNTRVSEGNANRGAAMSKHYDWLNQRQAQLEESIRSKDLDRAAKVDIARELIEVRRSIAEMNDSTRRDEGEANRTSREGEGDLNRNSREQQGELNRKNQFYINKENQYSRESEGDKNRATRTSEGDKNRLTGIYKQGDQQDFQHGENEANRKTRVFIDSSNRASREGENSKNRQAQADRQEDRQSESRLTNFYNKWFGSSESKKKRDFQAEQGDLNRTARSEENDKRLAAAAARSATNLNVRITQAANRSNDPNARFIVDHAQKAGEIELMQAHRKGASPAEIDAITEKYAQEVERALQRR